MLIIVMGTLSLISVIQRLFDVGVVSVCAKLIEYYGNAIDTVFTPLQYVVPFRIPPIVFDIWTLSIVASAAYIRAIFSKGKLNREQREVFENPLSFGIAVLICGLSGFGILLLLYTYSLSMDSLLSSERRQAMKESPQDWIMLGEIRANVFYVFGGCLAFYGLNALS